MTRRTTTIVTTFAGIALGTVVFAQQNQQAPQAQPTPRNIQNTPIPDQRPAMGQERTPVQPGERVGTGQEAGRQADQQVSQQLKQIAQDPQTAGDKLFILHAAMGNQWEIELARAAQQKASNQQVKQVAQQIMQDHQRAYEQAQRVAQQLDVQLPQGLAEEKQQVLQILSSLPTEQFEKQYISMMQADHAKDLIKYRATAQISQNDAVKQYAQQQIPVLSQHSDHVQQAAVALGLPTGGSEAIPAGNRPAFCASSPVTNITWLVSPGTPHHR